MECIWCEFNTEGNFRCLIGVFYRPPNTGMQFWSDLETSIDNAKETNVNNLILMGDFNDDQFANNSKLASIWESHNLVQLITEPTRVCNGSSTCIDVIAVSCPDLVCLAGTIDAKINDHHGIFCNLNEKSPRPKTYKRLIWKMSMGITMT